MRLGKSNEVHAESITLYPVRRFLITALAMFLSVAVFAPIAPTYATPNNLTIAYQGPLSGPESSTGFSQLNAVKFTIELFNDAFKGKYRVSLLEIDDQGIPGQAAKVAPVAAANEEILGIVGPAYSLSVTESLPFYKEKLIPLISPSATRVVLNDPTSPGGVFGQPVFHRIALSDKMQASKILEFATLGVEAPRVFIVNIREYGNELSSDLLNTISSNQFAGIDDVDYRTTDWAAVIGKINQYKANVVVFTSYSHNRIVRVGDSIYSSEFDPFLKQLRDQGYSGVITAAATGGVIPLKLISNELEVAFKTSTGNASGVFAAETIDATNVFLYCIANGVETRSQMLDCIKRFVGTSIKGGKFSFDENGDSTAPGYAAKFDLKDIRFLDSEFRQNQELRELLPRFPWYKSLLESIEKANVELKAKQEADAKAAAELKAKQEAEAKTAAELKAKQEADAKAVATKKKTITCVKGKLTKKVTAVKPKCPSGYKVKK
jgi:branched-chain amino acid transport system substrate-binding protein